MSLRIYKIIGNGNCLRNETNVWSDVTNQLQGALMGSPNNVTFN